MPIGIQKLILMKYFFSFLSHLKPDFLSFFGGRSGFTRSRERYPKNE
jgi:hypothetical protein